MNNIILHKGYINLVKDFIYIRNIDHLTVGTMFRILVNTSSPFT